jgi:sirohydrochlorin cobaltochelatase
MSSVSSSSRSAVLLVAFGSTLPHTQKIYAHVLGEAQKRYHGSTVFMAFSSRMVLAKLEREGRPGLNVEAAVKQIAEQGYANLRIIPLFAIAGEDFSKWSSPLAELALKFQSYSLASPLFSSRARVEQVARIVLHAFPERQPQELLVLMSHGSPHAEGARFTELAEVLHRMDNRAFMGSVEGEPWFADVLAKMDAASERQVVLAPCMMVTGDHAMNDMAGADEDSWKSQLEKRGYTVRVVQRGLLEIPAIVDLLLGIPL